MGFNLANERIQDSYPQLVQISGSTLVNGNGEVIDDITNISSVSASYAATASLADYATNAATASTAASANVANQAALVNVTATSTNLDYPLLFTYSNGFQEARIDSQNLALYYNPSTNRLTATNVTVTGALTGSVVGNLTGTASFATNALTASYALNGGGGGDSFPYTGSALISGSLITTGSVFINKTYPSFSSDTGSIFQISIDNDTLGKKVAMNVRPIFPFGQPIVEFPDANISSSDITITDRIHFGYNSYIQTPQSAGDALEIYGANAPALPGANVRIRAYDTFEVLNGAGPGLTVTQQSVNLGSYGFPGPTPTHQITSSSPHHFLFGASGSFSGSFQGSFTGDGAGLYNLAGAPFGAETFFNAPTYTIDVPGDTNDPAYDIHISQSGVYFISASKVPPYAANGPRINLIYWPELLGSGEVAKVKFFVPGNDTGTGVSYKPAVTCSAGYEWFWNSTTLPASATTSNIARNLSYPQHANGIGVTNMIKGGDGYVYFSTATTPVPSQNYFITGPSISLLT